jgi:hypothetical protein
MTYVPGSTLKVTVPPFAVIRDVRSDPFLLIVSVKSDAFAVPPWTVTATFTLPVVAACANDTAEAPIRATESASAPNFNRDDIEKKRLF